MLFRTLALSLLVLSSLSIAAPGRAPAVEDFVGIEVEPVPMPSHGDEALFNLEQDLGKIESAQKTSRVDVAASPRLSPFEESWSLSKIMGILLVLSLPLVSWLHVLNHMRRKAGLESASNIEVLEKYRQEREQAKNRKDDLRKAS